MLLPDLKMLLIRRASNGCCHECGVYYSAPTGLSDGKRHHGKGLKRGQIRLAWYSKTYGSIPDAEIVKLTLVGHGLRDDANTRELFNEARAIKDYLLSLSSSPNG